MFEFLNSFLKKRYAPLNQIVVSRENLTSNYRILGEMVPGVGVAPVVKSNAYGHGIVEAAKILDPLSAPFFCVDSIFEAYQLLKSHIKTSVLIMGYVDPKNLVVKKLPFSYAVWDLGLVRAISKYQQGANIHIFVDTGMNREGVGVGDLEEFMKKVIQIGGVRVAGLMTHLAEADKPKSDLSKKQLKKFLKAQEIIKKLGINLEWVHLGGSEAFFWPGIVKYGNLVRSGIALYGLGREAQLKPVLKMTTKIVQIKQLSQHEQVGYEGAFTATNNMVAGVLPLGYYDGVDRRLSNKGYVLVNGHRCRILGRVSMNLTTVDLSTAVNPAIGQEVIVFSDNPTDPNSIFNCARICKTIPYDLLIHLAPSTKRVVVQDH